MARVLARRSLPSGRIAKVVMSEAADGDIPVGGPELSPLIGDAPNPWTSLRQVHGARVAVVSGPGDCQMQIADAAVTSALDTTLSVRVADCVPVALIGDDVIGTAHAGWRGLVAGVLDSAVHEIRSLSRSADSPIEAVVGPHVHACCYEFQEQQIGVLVDEFGSEVRSSTRDGHLAVDLAFVVNSALTRLGIDVTADGACTACDDRYWSFRLQGTSKRQAMLAWMEAEQS